ncbi:MAG: Ku protein [Acidimicrobiales bacterium]|jgi:DNA end-binding protein Ku
MAKAVWTGSLSFGLVNVPVGLYSATEDQSIHFNQFRAGTSERIRNKRVGEQSGEEVAYADIVKGYDLGGGEYVILTPEELASVAPGPSRTIEVTDFVDISDIDPIYFDKPYFLAPHGKNGDRAYELLRRVMEETNKVAIATFVMREKQYLVAVRPEKSALVLETLLFADEVRDPVKEIDVLPVQANFEVRELDMAKLLIDSMTTDWEPARYRDTYRERVEELIDQKRQGTVVVSDGPRAEPAPVVDLLAALQASVSAARGRPGASAGDIGKASSLKERSPARADKVGNGAKPGRTSSKPTHRRESAEKASGLSRAELLRQAGEIGIQGRSKMSREQLEQAVAETSNTRRKKAS